MCQEILLHLQGLQQIFDLQLFCHYPFLDIGAYSVMNMAVDDNKVKKFKMCTIGHIFRTLEHQINCQMCPGTWVAKLFCGQELSGCQLKR